MSVNHLNPIEMNKLAIHMRKAICTEDLAKKPIRGRFSRVENSVNKELPAAESQRRNEEQREGVAQT